MDGLSSLSSVGWVHFKLSGGWRATLAICALYAAIITGMAFMTAYDTRRGTFEPRVFEGWAYGLVWLQGLIVLGFGTQRVTAAVRRDTVSNMLESHRLMPIAAPQAILGYILGPTVPVLALGVANTILAAVFIAQAGISVETILPTQFLMASTILFLWPAAAIWSLMARFALGGLVVFSFIYFLSQGALAVIFPGLLVLLGPAVVNLPFFRGSYTGLSAAGFGALLAQVAFGATFFAAAARRYSRSDRPAFGMPLGLVLLALCTAASAIGTIYFEEFFTTSRFRFARSPTTPVPTLVALLLIALIPVSGAARYVASASLHFPRVSQRVSLGLFTLLLALLMIGLYPFSFYGAPEQYVANFLDNMASRLAITFFSGGCFLLAIYFFLALLYRMPLSPIATPALAVLWIFCTVLGPVILDAIRHAVFDFGNNEILGPLGCVSPLGSIIKAWSPPEQSGQIWIGLVFQGMIAALPLAAFSIVSARRKRPALAPQNP